MEEFSYLTGIIFINLGRYMQLHQVPMEKPIDILKEISGIKLSAVYMCVIVPVVKHALLEYLKKIKLDKISFLVSFSYE